MSALKDGASKERSRLKPIYDALKEGDIRAALRHCDRKEIAQLSITKVCFVEKSRAVLIAT
jgi:hypothetical protein